MLLTKAFISKLPDEGSNIYQVRVPLMEDNTQGEAIYDATCCASPGTFNAYQVGDCVYVDFEDEEITTAVIMGKLVTEEIEEENNVYTSINDLNVTGRTVLPEDTTIGGYTISDLVSMINTASNSANSVTNSGGGFSYKTMREW